MNISLRHIKKLTLMFFVMHILVRAALLFSPLMSDIFAFEVSALEDTAWYSFFSDIFYIKLISQFTDNVLFLRSIYFILSLAFIFLLFDVLKTYFSEESSFLWGGLFLSMPPAFFSYRSILFTDTFYIFLISTLIGFKFMYKLFYQETAADKNLKKIVGIFIFLFSTVYILSFYKYGRVNSFLAGIKYFYMEVVPFMFGYMSDFRSYVEFARDRVFFVGLYIYFTVFFLWQGVFKNKNLLKFFKKDYSHTNKTELFFILHLLFVLFFIFTTNSASVKGLVFGFLYIGFSGMFCFFMSDVFSETKIFAFILCIIVMYFSVSDNKYLLKKAYSVKEYGETKKTALKIKAMGTKVVFSDNDLWLPLKFYLKDEGIKCIVLDEDTRTLPALGDSEVLLVHKDKGVFSPQKVKLAVGYSSDSEIVIGKYHIFS